MDTHVCTHVFTGIKDMFWNSFSDMCSDDVYVALQNSAVEAQGTKAGLYSRNGTSSGYPAFYQTVGGNAIWFKNGKWRIGSKGDIGTTTQSLLSTGTTLSCPESEAIYWNYYSNSQWIDAGQDVVISPYLGMS